MSIAEHAALILLALTALLFCLLLLVDVRQLHEEKHDTQDKSEYAESEIWSGHCIGSLGLAGDDDVGDEYRCHSSGSGVEGIRQCHAESSLFRRTEHHDVWICHELKHHDTESHDEHAAEEHGIYHRCLHTEQRRNAKVVDYESDAHNGESEQQGLLVAYLVHHHSKRNGESIGSIECCVYQLSLRVFQSESLFAELNHRIVHCCDEADKKHHGKHHDKRKRIVRRLLLLNIVHKLVICLYIYVC